MERNPVSLSVVIGMIIGIGVGQVGMSRALPTSTSPPEKECVVYSLPSEIVEQLLTAANASLSHLQDKRRFLEGHEGNEEYARGLSQKGRMDLGASPDLLILLLHTMEREQARHDRELARLIQERNVVVGPITEGRSNTNHQQVPERLLEAVIELQRDVRQLQTQQPLSANTETARDYGMKSESRIGIENVDCYLSDAWPHDCFDLAQQGKNESGVYTIYPYRCRRGERGVRVWCDMEGKDDKWTVVLSRHPLEKQLDFNRGWRDYREGFGDPETEYWIGNDILHDMTNERPQILLVEMTDWDENERYAQYQTFLVEDEDAQYRLHVGQYSGDAGTSFSEHDNMRFSTSDRDNDNHGSNNCAATHKGGFWYKRCHKVSPTSLLLEKQKSSRGITWHSWYSDYTTLKKITFKLKPKSCYRN